jgi:hypothetical protein
VLNVANEGAVAVYVTGAVTPATPFACFIAQAALARLVNSAMPSLRVKLFVSPMLVSFPLPLASGLAILELNGPSFTLSADS